MSAGNMRKPHNVKETTDNVRTYKMAHNRLVSGCPVCAPHRGCNRRRIKNQRNWKVYRKTKWK